MDAVGIDISKGRSVVAALRPLGEVAIVPREFSHTAIGLKTLAKELLALGENTRVAMEATGHYHEPVAAALHKAGLFVSVLNPIVIHEAGSGVRVRKVKNDRKDALKIAKFGLDNWMDLCEYTPMDAIRQQLKLFSRQYNLYMKTIRALQNNFISLLDKTFPGVNELFNSPTRQDGRQKWIDFAASFWHCECVCRMSLSAFTERYRKWCVRNGYNFTANKANEIHAASAGHFTTLPKSSGTKLLITSAAAELTAASKIAATVKAEMIRLAAQLPEWETVRAMFGVGDITGAQLIAELGDVRRFANRSSIVGFAGIDPVVDQSGKQNPISNPTSKRGSPHLRRTLFQIISIYLRCSPANEAVYQFLDKKRSEGKAYYVYMTAAANKFLRIYYARVKETMEKPDE